LLKLRLLLPPILTMVRDAFTHHFYACWTPLPSPIIPPNPNPTVEILNENGFIFCTDVGFWQKTIVGKKMTTQTTTMKAMTRHRMKS